MSSLFDLYLQQKGTEPRNATQLTAFAKTIGKAIKYKDANRIIKEKKNTVSQTSSPHKSNVGHNKHITTTTTSHVHRNRNGSNILFRDIENMSFVQLKARCTMEGASAIGTKDQLIERLRQHLNQSNISTPSATIAVATPQQNTKKQTLSTEAQIDSKPSVSSSVQETTTTQHTKKTTTDTSSIKKQHNTSSDHSDVVHNDENKAINHTQKRLSHSTSNEAIDALNTAHIEYINIETHLDDIRINPKDTESANKNIIKSTSKKPTPRTATLVPPSKSSNNQSNKPSIPKKKQYQSPNTDVITRLQDVIHAKTKENEQLTNRIRALEQMIETLQPQAQRARNDDGIQDGPDQKAAAALLSGLLGGHVKHKRNNEEKETTDCISTGVSPEDAAAALGGVFVRKKKAAPKRLSGQGIADKFLKYNQIFKKYEIMMKLGINVHGVVGRMRQDGVDKEVIAAFEKKHGADQYFEDIDDPLEYGLKQKKEITVSKGIKMKRLNWTSVPMQYIKGSLWERLDDDSIRYDHKHFELFFQVRQRKPLNERKQNVECVQKITFVPKKRTQQVLIVLATLDLNHNALRTALLDMDETVMGVDTIAKLLEIAPTMKEQKEAKRKIMQEGTQRVTDYATAEQFFLALSDFYQLHQRLKLWMFKQNYFEICDGLLEQYKTIGKTCDKLASNKHLRLLMSIILRFGNHMNSGTHKGQQHGFDLNILTEINEISSFDDTRSLLMYIYEFCDRKYPQALMILPQLSNTLKVASSLEIETLKQLYQRIQENMNNINNLITSDEIENYDIDDRFIMELTRFHKAVTPKMKKFRMIVGNVMVSTKRVMKKWCYGTEEEPQSIESFFHIWWTFIQDFADAKEKLIALEKERQKRMAKRKQKKNKTIQKKMHIQHGNRKPLQRGSSLYKELEKRQKFDQRKDELHKSLLIHVKKKSAFIANNGQLDANTRHNETMRRISSMYQNQQDEVRALRDAQKKAAILKYNKFKLPDINKSKRRWTAETFLNSSFSNIPDDTPLMAPMTAAKRNKWMHKDIDEWSTEDLQDWISELKLETSVKSKLIKGIKEEGMKGVDFNECLCADDISESFEDIDESIGVMIYEELEKRRKNKKQSVVQNAPKQKQNNIQNVPHANMYNNAANGGYGRNPNVSYQQYLKHRITHINNKRIII